MHVSLVTTATIPWFTGPAISAIERIYAIQQAGHQTTLYTPWAKPEIQRHIFPQGLEFATQDEHLIYLQSFLRQQGRKLDIRFYETRWEKNVFFPAIPLAQFVEPCDVLILEEAEHLLWNQLFCRRIRQANYILGILQTNYKERGKYAAGPFNLKIHAFRLLLPYYNAWICQRNCDRVISVSRSIEYAAPIHIAQINGIRDSFIQPQAEVKPPQFPQFDKDFYYLGSVAWEKNLKQLIDFCESCQITIDIYGSGTNYDRGSTLEQIRAYACVHGNYLNFCGTTSEPHITLKPYKTYISCSVSEGYCAANAEAIAMGKFVILVRHPSNEFFYAYDNVLLFANQQEFEQCIQYSLSHEPVPLSLAELEQLGWRKKVQLLLSKFIPSNI